MTSAQVTTFVLVRHGHTEANELGHQPVMSGWVEIPLSEVGCSQLSPLADAMTHRPPAVRIYSSPSRRAYLTARAIATRLGLEIEVDPDLREIYCGVVDGVAVEDVMKRYPALWEANLRQDDDDFRWPGGESYREFRHRCLRCLERFAGRHPGQRVIVVTHSGFIAQISGVIRGARPAQWEPCRPDNASLTEVEWDRGRLKLLTFNENTHLSAGRPAG